MNKQILPWLITFCAIGLGGTAGYYSVIGLSKLFAGEATAVIIMASFLEISKLVLATLLHAYWDNLNKLLKTYYISALVILSIITSAGIYGMLSSGYQKTSSELTIVENQKEFLAQKIDFYQKDLNIYNTELERISNNISTLSNAKSITTQVRDNNATGGIRSVVSTTELKLAQQRISVEEKNRNDVQSKRQIVADSLQNLQLQLLELDNNSETAGELGPLKYLANLTGISMGRIINWILLVIIFVFDPLAISLVIAANFAFSQSQSKISPKLEEQVENMREVVESYDSLDNEIENYITPENVPDIKLDMDNNGILDVKEINSAYLKMQELETQIQNPNISSWKRTRLQNQINQIKAQLEEEDTTKIY
jgi:hypothetical protein